MSLKNEEIDQVFLRDKLQIIKTSIAIFDAKYSKFFNKDDKGILLKINNSINSIKSELDKLDEK